MKKKSLSNQLVTKSDLKALEKKLETRMDGLDSRMDGLKDEVKVLGKKLEEKFNIVMNHIDGLAKMVKDIAEEFTIHNLTHQRNSETLEEHGERISHLETAVFH